MTSKYIEAVTKKFLKPDQNMSWLKNNLHYEVIMGSQAYGVSRDASDMDIYGWCIPPKHLVFPQSIGYVDGFGPRPQNFEQFQQHHVIDTSTAKQYDFTIYSVVKYLNLVVENNPNMIDSLFVPENCVTHITSSGQVLRDARRSFLHKGAYHKFKGYAYAQIHKMKTKEMHEDMSSKRKADIDAHGYDTKFAYHCVRLLDECEQILTIGDVDLQRNNEQLKAIRRGEWTEDQLHSHFDTKMVTLESQYQACTLPHGPNWGAASSLLLSILEDHYGSLSEVVSVDRYGKLLADIEAVLASHRS